MTLTPGGAEASTVASQPKDRPAPSPTIGRPIEPCGKCGGSRPAGLDGFYYGKYWNLCQGCKDEFRAHRAPYAGRARTYRPCSRCGAERTEDDVAIRIGNRVACKPCRDVVDALRKPHPKPRRVLVQWGEVRAIRLHTDGETSLIKPIDSKLYAKRRVPNTNLRILPGEVPE